MAHRMKKLTDNRSSNWYIYRGVKILETTTKNYSYSSCNHSVDGVTDGEADTKRGIKDLIDREIDAPRIREEAGEYVGQYGKFMREGCYTVRYPEHGVTCLMAESPEELADKLAREMTK